MTDQSPEFVTPNELMARAAARLRDVLPSFTDPSHHSIHADRALVRDLEAASHFATWPDLDIGETRSTCACGYNGTFEECRESREGRNV